MEMVFTVKHTFLGVRMYHRGVSKEKKDWGHMQRNICFQPSS